MHKHLTGGPQSGFHWSTSQHRLCMFPNQPRTQLLQHLTSPSVLKSSSAYIAARDKHLIRMPSHWRPECLMGGHHNLWIQSHLINRSDIAGGTLNKLNQGGHRNFAIFVFITYIEEAVNEVLISDQAAYSWAGRGARWHWHLGVTQGWTEAVRVMAEICFLFLHSLGSSLSLNHTHTVTGIIPSFRPCAQWKPESLRLPFTWSSINENNEAWILELLRQICKASPVPKLDRKPNE